MRARALLTAIAERPLAIIPLAILAVAERLAYTLGHIENRDTELRNVALSWARTGWVADAFQPGSGPTAHVGALPPVIPGSVLWLFGDTSTAAIVLTVMVVLAIVGTAFVLNRAFAHLGTPPAWRGAAMLVVAVVPLHLELEARSLRVYENATAALGLALVLWATLRLDARQRVTTRDMIGLSGLAALLVALSPITGVTAIAMLGLLALRRLDWRGRVQALAILSTILFATMLPWAMRNQAVMGETVWTRGNFGLEFALGTHAGAVDPNNPGQAYLDRLAAIHPHQSPPAYAAMQAAGGELPYARNLAAATERWVAANPGDALRIWARHAVEWFFPPPWLWAHIAQLDATMPWRMLIVDAVAALALIGLTLALTARDWRFVYLLPPVVLLPIPYLLSQPLVRYRYVVASLFVFLAVEGVARLARRRPRSPA